MAEREQARRSQNVTMVMVKMRKGNVKNRHYNINILFIYSEQMTAFPKSILTKMTMTTLTIFSIQGTLIQGVARIRPLPCFRVLVTLKKYHKNGQNEQKCINYTSIFCPLFFELLKMLIWWLSAGYVKLPPVTIHFFHYYARYERVFWLILQSEKPKWVNSNL